jgi:Spy/CpxP family protein refolding chaperone
MKNYKFWLAIVVLLLLINSVVLYIIWFKKTPVENSHQQAEPKDVLISTLSLSPKQQEQYTVMRNQHHELTSRLNNENHALRDSLFANIKKPTVDSAVVNALTKKISDNQSLIEKATLYHFREFRAILTAVQQPKFDGIINDVLRMMGRPGPMGGERGRDNHPGPPPDGMPPPDRDGPQDGQPPR